MHQPIPEQGAWIEQVVRGFFYHAVPTNGAALKAFYYYVERIWLRTLRRQRVDTVEKLDFLPR
jgi:RNA-directed DNA polymerase